MTDINTFIPTAQHIHLMQHALGINEHKREPWRNYFYVESEHPDWQVLIEHGYAERQKAPSFTTGGFTYYCTEKGCSKAISALPEQEKLSRQQEKYQDFLSADGRFDDFAHFLGIYTPEVEIRSPEYGHYEYRMYRKVWSELGFFRDVVGEWCKTKKAAKASYKAALKIKKEKEKENIYAY